MPPKLTYEYVKEIISNAGDKMVSTQYENAHKLLKIECGECGEIYKQNLNRFKKGGKHSVFVCTEKKKTRKFINPLIEYNKLRKVHSIKNTTRKCIYCKKEFNLNRRKQILCNTICQKGYQRQKAKDGHYKIIGSIGGKISVTKQNRRSKNEVYFYKLCEEWFGKKHLQSNSQIFNGWDADIVIHSHRIAISWNGVWHYKQICKNTTVESIQKRDDLKEIAIKKYKYDHYVIKDMGGYNRKFVEEQFDLFKLYLIEYEVEESNIFYCDDMWFIDDLE